VVLDRDKDIQSKYTFWVSMLLFSIADTGIRGFGPVVTIPPTSDHPKHYADGFTTSAAEWLATAARQA
jgi:hypothetical protein